MILFQYLELKIKPTSQLVFSKYLFLLFYLTGVIEVCPLLLISRIGFHHLLDSATPVIKIGFSVFSEYQELVEEALNFKLIIRLVANLITLLPNDLSSLSGQTRSLNLNL